jgi:hypothetical protein
VFLLKETKEITNRFTSADDATKWITSDINNSNARQFNKQWTIIMEEENLLTPQDLQLLSPQHHH